MTEDTFPQDEREITDHDFFRALDFSIPGLRTVEQAYRSSDMEQARDAVVRYFRTRETPAWSFDVRSASKDLVMKSVPAMILGSRQIDVEDIIAFANDALDHEFGADRFGRLYNLSRLSVAYLLNGDRAYVDKYVEILQTFLDQHPPFPGKHVVESLVQIWVLPWL